MSQPIQIVRIQGLLYAQIPNGNIRLLTPDELERIGADRDHNTTPRSVPHVQMTDSQTARTSEANSTSRFAVASETDGPSQAWVRNNFLRIESGGFPALLQFTNQYPAVWSLSHDELESIWVVFYNRGLTVEADRAAERYMLLREYRESEWTAPDAAAYLTELADSPRESTIRQDFDNRVTAIRQRLLRRRQARLEQVRLGQSGTGSGRGEAGPRTSRARANASQTGTGVQPDPQNSIPETAGTSASHMDGGMLADVAYRMSQTGLGSRIPISLARPVPKDNTQTGLGSRIPISLARPVPRDNTARAPFLQRRCSIRPNETGSLFSLDLNSLAGEPAAYNADSSCVGPREDMLRGVSDVQLAPLHRSFYQRTGRDAPAFFVKGRVFAILWHESLGSDSKARSNAKHIRQGNNPGHFISMAKNGDFIFSHIRRFVIVKARRNYCWVVPITSHGGRALTAKKKDKSEIQSYAIIYANGNLPQSLDGEPRLHKNAICVNMAPGESLSESSRIHFGSPTTIQWNVKVKNIGIIDQRQDLRNVVVYFRQEFLRDDASSEETDENQPEARPGRPSRPSERQP